MFHFPRAVVRAYTARPSHNDPRGVRKGATSPCTKRKFAPSNMCLHCFTNVFMRSSSCGWRRIRQRAVPQISVIGGGSALGFGCRVGIGGLLSSSHPFPGEETTAMARKPPAEKAARMRQIVNGRPMDEWDKCWAEGATPWDLGQVTPIIKHLADKDLLPQGRALIPGCGAGYDVLALGGPNRYVVGLDISENALKRARELAASAPNAKYVEFLNADFFTWASPELFDLLIDYTFFCAIEPPMRPDWAKRVAELLKPGGELITLMFPISEHMGGPPYAVSVPEYEEVLHPVGFKAILIENNEMAIGSRKGREWLGRWKRKDVPQSLL